MTISPSKDCWSRYDIDTNFRVLAEWLGPDVPRAMTLPELQWLSGAQESCESANGPLEISNHGLVDPRIPEAASSTFPPSPSLTGCSRSVLMGKGVSRRERLATFDKIRGRDRRRSH